AAAERPPVTPTPPRVMWPAPSDYTPYTLRLDVDLPLLILGGTLWGATAVVGAGSAQPSWCGTMSTPPCDPTNVNVLDRTAVGLNDDGARVAANAMAGIVPAGFAILDIVDAGITHWRGWLTDAVVITEAAAWSGAIQDIVRRAVRRPRPYMYAPGLNP